MSLSAAAKFCDRFASGHRAGLDFVTLLKSEAKHGPGHQQRAMSELAAGAAKGEQLHSLMEKQAPYFPILLTTMIAVGEETGKLEQSLRILSKHMREKLETRKTFIKSIAWPGIQLFAAIGVLSLLIYLMGILTPPGGGQMADILGLGLRGGEGVLKFWACLSLFFGAIGIAVFAYARNWFGLHNLAPLSYMIPKLGPAIQTITIARFCHTMALAFEAGLDPIRSIKLGLDSTGSTYYSATAGDAEIAIRKGSSLAGALEATSLFPQDFIARVDIGEQSGTDAEAMNLLAREYDERANAAMRFMAMVATILIRVTVAGILIFFIFRIASTYLGALNSASEPILPRRGN